MGNPFEDESNADAVDFPVNHWVTDFLANLGALMEYVHAGSADTYAQDAEEEQRSRTRFYLCKAEVCNFLNSEEGIKEYPQTPSPSRRPLLENIVMAPQSNKSSSWHFPRKNGTS